MKPIKIVDFGPGPHEVRVGQIRRWSMENSKHSASGLVFRVNEIDREKYDVPYVHGTYLKRGEHPSVTRETPVQWTSANIDYVLENSTLVKTPANYLTVDVTQKDIDEGMCENPFTCAVARAIRRAASKRWRRWDNLVCAIVGANGIVFRDETNEWGYKGQKEVFKYDVPQEVTSFIHRFDTSKGDRSHLKPFTFRFEVPERFVRGV